MSSTPLLTLSPRIPDYGGTKQSQQPLDFTSSKSNVLLNFDLLSQITSFLSSKESRIFLLDTSKQILSTTFPELKSYWDSHPLYPIYNHYLQELDERHCKNWVNSLKKLLEKEVAVLTAITGTTNMSHLLPLHRTKNLCQKLLPELQQIPHLIRQRSWKRTLIPFRSRQLTPMWWGEFCLLGIVCTGASGALLATILGCAHCCCGVHLSSMVSNSLFMGVYGAPVCTAVSCIDCQSLYQKNKTRFKKIEQIYVQQKNRLKTYYEQYLNLLPNPHYSDIQQRQICREQCYDQIEAIIEVAQSVGPVFLPGLESLIEQLPGIRKINSLEITETDLRCLNQTRLVLRGIDNQLVGTSPLSPESQNALESSFQTNNPLDMAAIMSKNLMDVCPLAEEISSNEGLSYDFAPFFVRYGGDLSMIPHLSAPWLWHLLNANIFAKDPTLLDHLCSKEGKRYDLAFVFFLFDFNSSEIQRLLKYNQLARFDVLKSARNNIAQQSQNHPRQLDSLARQCLTSLFPQVREENQLEFFFQQLEQANNVLQGRLAEQRAAEQRAANRMPPH